MKYTINFFVDKTKDSPTAHIRCRVRFHEPDGQYALVSFNVGYRALVASWSSADQRCKRNTQHGQYSAQSINAEINRIEGIIDNIFASATSLTKDEFRERYKAAMCPVASSVPLVCDVVDRFIAEAGLSWSDATKKKFVTMRRRILAYGMNAPITSCDRAYLAKYVATLAENMHNRSAHKEYKLITWFLRWCKDVKILDTDFDDYAFKLRQYEHKVIFFDWDEFMHIYNLSLPSLHLREIRDIFCFCCLSGLRYSDIRHLKRDDCYADHIGVTTIKTGCIIDIPLNKYSKEILKRYDNYDSTNRAFPVPNNSEYNETIKEVIEIASRTCESLRKPITLVSYKGSKRIEETDFKYNRISTHTARRTFICNSLILGIPAEVLMKITGHSSYASLKPYINVTSAATKEAMSLYDRL